jgi:hypothetical protein
MENNKLRNYLEVGTNVAVLLVAMTILSTFALSFIQRKPTPVVSKGIEKGQHLPAIPGISYDGSPRTLLIAMNTKCSYCTASIPFYNQLAGLQQSDNNPLHIVAAFPNTADEVKQYLSQHKLAVESHDSVALGQLKVAGAPTIILVDQSGRVLDFWVGELKPETQQQVLKSIAAGGNSSA